MYEYSIFSIILDNNNKEKEHVLSIIYIFKETAFYEYILDYEEDTFSQLVLQLILFVFFGSILLYIITLSFKILAKFIVVPIKNVYYMLEGINIGGEYRLEYLSDLKKKQEENLEKLNKIHQELYNKNIDKSDNIITNRTEEKENNMKQNKEKNNILLSDENKNKINDNNKGSSNNNVK